MMNIEVLGCGSRANEIGQDKFMTKALAESAGVPVPKGELLRKHLHAEDLTATAERLLAKQSAPFIVKPAREDNSIGLSLVKESTLDAVTAALRKAFEHDEFVLVEEYIAGRECRVAVLEVEGENGVSLEILPKLEYVLEDIREQKHKLGTDSNGKLLTGDGNVDGAFHKARAEGERICPAVFDAAVDARMDALVKKAHVALGCKYYSLYDLRITKDGFPYMLESCLFCSFSPFSVIVGMASKSTDSRLQQHPKVFEDFLRRAAKKTRAMRSKTSQMMEKMVVDSGYLKRPRIEAA